MVVGSWLNKATFVLMGRKEIGSVRDLKGKRFAVSQLGDAPSNYTIALLKAFGLNSARCPMGRCRHRCQRPGRGAGE